MPHFRHPSFLCIISLIFLTVAKGHAEDRVIGAILDCSRSEPKDLGPTVSPWFWDKAMRAEAGTYSNNSIVDVDGVRCLRMTIGDDLPWTRDRYDVDGTLRPDYLDPTCDAVRLHCKVVRGSFRITIGSPTCYFANSDVFTNPVTLEPTAEWQDVVIPLDSELWRNFRRAGFSGVNPVISYTRWIQEGMRLWFLSGTHGELLVQRIDLLSQGRGQPYPLQPTGGLPAVGPILVPASDDLFSIFIQRDLAFTDPPKISNQNWKTPTASMVVTKERPQWAITMRGAEEVVFAGAKLTIPANAQALTMEIDAGASAKDPVCLEFLFVVADGAVPWESFVPPPAWRSDPATSFDAYLTATTTATTSIALYHVRRAVSADASTPLLIPWDDALCIWGSGACEAYVLEQKPLLPEQIRAVLVTPAFRHAKAESHFAIAQIQPVTLPENWTARRSYYQADLSGLTSERDATGTYGGSLIQHHLSAP